MLDQKKIGKFIFDLRTEKGISQNTLAKQIPISRQAVSNWEQGKSIPDSSTLLILSEMFGVSINELLLGERENKDTKTEIQNVMLNMLDDNNKKKKKIRQIIIIFSVIITMLSLSFFIYYFVTSYNTIKVYKVGAENNIFLIKDGILITTKDKMYLRLGKMKYKKSIQIDRIEIYCIDKNNNKNVIYKDKQTDVLITDINSYDQKILRNNLDRVYMEISYNNDIKEKMKLSITKDFSNNAIISTNNKSS